MSIQYRLAWLLVAAAFLSGFLNLVPMPGYYLATAIIDVCLLAMIVFGGWYLSRHQDEQIDAWMVFLAALIGTFVALAVLSPETPYALLSTIRSRGLYIIAGAFIAITFTDKSELKRLIQWMMRFAAIIAAFGVVQFVMRGTLPSWLLYSKDTELFAYFGTDITRSTGLIGNSIVYANTMLLFFSIAASRFAARPGWRELGYPALFGLAIYVSFSRTALAGAAFVLIAIAIVELVRRGSRSAIQFVSVTSAIAVAGGILVVSFTDLAERIQGSFVYQGLLLGGNESVQGSTEQHLLLLETGTKVLGESAFIGLGLATQTEGSEFANYNTLITDSAWSALLAEGGVVLAGAYAAFLVAAMVTVFRRMKYLNEHAYLARGFLVFSLYEFGFASVVNSAVFGKAVFLSYWIYFGAILAFSRRSPVASRTVPSDEHFDLSSVSTQAPGPLGIPRAT